MRRQILGLLAATALALPMAANAARNVQTGSAGGLTFKAQSSSVGVDSNATTAFGGNPIYLGNTAAYSGVVALIMDYGAGGSFICSGTLASDRRSIITAGHCVSGGAGTPGPLSVTAYFGGGTSPTDRFNGPGTTAIDVSDIFVNPAYTGEVIDQNDIAVLRLRQYAPDSAMSHDILTVGDLTGFQFNTAGYGARSDGGGNVGANLGAGRLRQGLNDYDFALGDSVFGGFFTDADSTGEKFFGTADTTFSYISDFDNGLAANDASCLLATNFDPSAIRFCDLGGGLREVAVAGGDSGGPQFINGKLASVTSYGLSFGPDFGDVDGDLNSTFGEFSGYVPTFIHADFIRGSLVAPIPEPATWLQMIFGFGLIGSVLRRRQSTKVAVA